MMIICLAIASLFLNPAFAQALKDSERLNSEGFVLSADPAINELPYCANVLNIKPPKGTPETEPKNPPLPEVMKATAYDEAEACPDGCRNPHVVFHDAINGTSRAHKPGPIGQAYKKCVDGQPCEICFRDGTECMTIKYAGKGPPYGVFDFPMAYYKAACGKGTLLPPLQKKCDEFESAAARYRRRLNCIAQPTHALCKDIIEQAQSAWKADRPKFLQCKKMGQDKYNVGLSVDDQRVVRCGYTKLSYIFKTSYGGKACKRPWHILKPGACREGTYPGPSGLDCCSADPFEMGAMGGDCLKFYPVNPLGGDALKPSSSVK